MPRSTKSATAKCAAGTLRRASRSIARVYDARLARAGLTTTQFSIMRALQRRAEPVPLSDLSEELVFERTSMYRALAPLRRDGLIAFARCGHSKQVFLTAKGRRRAAQALPHWRVAQEDFVALLGRAAWNELAAKLAAIVDVARAMPARG